MGFEIGQKVLVHGRNSGVVRYYGEVKFEKGTWIGVELDKPLGRNNGSVEGVAYFSCEPLHGIFVTPLSLSMFSREVAAAIGIQRLFRGIRDRKEVAVSQRFSAWDELDMKDEHDYLAQTKDLGGVDRQLELKRAESPTRLKRQDTLERVNLKARLIDRMQDLAQRLDPEAESAQGKYKGPILSGDYSIDMGHQVYEHLLNDPNTHIHKKYVLRVLLDAIDHLKNTIPNSIPDLAVQADTGEAVKLHDASVTRLIVVGDTHGQLEDVLWIFGVHGLPSKKNRYLFNGDIADRGRNAVDIFILLLTFMLAEPESIRIVRGNHESSRMNIRDFSEGGGFSKEVRTKYGGDVYKLFKQFFYQLPLGYVINSKILVVHGGLTRKHGVTLQQLRMVNRLREVPEAPNTYEDTLFLDTLWADPQEVDGHGPQPARGEGCIRFGPDITKRFLERNKLQLCIRSHEVPSDLRGFKMHHGGKLITIFSASNYCGVTGNRGGVMILYPDMHYKIFEHAAPTRDELHVSLEKIAEGGKRPDIDKTLMKSKTFKAKDQQVQRMDQDILQKLMRRICEKKSDLWWYYSQEDTTRTGLITPAKWREGLSAVLELYNIPWTVYQKSLVRVQKNGLLNYREFLDRYRLQLNQEYAMWQHEVITDIFNRLMNEDLSLHDTFSLFDKDKNGRISIKEFQQVLGNWDIGLTEVQIVELIRALDWKEGSIDVNEFFERLNKLFNRALLRADSSVKSPNSAETLRILRTFSKLLHIQLETETFSGVFSSMDTDNNGYLCYEEFVRAMRSLAQRFTKNPAEERELLSISDDDLEAVARWVDVNQNGTINYFEFVSAFELARESFPLDNVIQHICGIIFQNRMTLRHIFEQCDKDLDGSVTPHDFQNALHVLNNLLASPTPPLSDQQIARLTECIALDCDGKIGYDEFLESFHVVDTINR